MPIQWFRASSMSMCRFLAITNPDLAFGYSVNNDPAISAVIHSELAVFRASLKSIRASALIRRGSTVFDPDQNSGNEEVKRAIGLNNFRSIGKWNQGAMREKLIRCHCGLTYDYLTSLTDENPGRRFVRCCKRNYGGCNFWEWLDLPMEWN